MAFSRRLSRGALLVFAVLTLLSCCEASFLDTFRQTVLSVFKPSDNNQAADIPQQTAEKPKRDGKRVAIIGAGAAGSSTSYFLRRFLANSTINKLPVGITIYDKHAYVGGRSTTVNAYDDPALPIELGASIFVNINHNLVTAAKELGLNASVAAANTRYIEEDDNADILGVYDGEKLVFTYPDGKWWSMAKLVYRYGPLALWRTKKLTETVVNKFLAMYQAPLFPFHSLSDVIETSGLISETGVTGSQLLEANGISGAFAEEMIQASTRVNYGQNLGLIHGVETMVCMATDGAMSIEGGNWRIFHGMANASNVDLRLRTPVSKIARSADGEWTVTSKKNGGTESTEAYDSVVIAGPLQFTNIEIEPKLEKKPDVIPYATLHVTLFASTNKLDPVFFGLKAGEKVPNVILTTLNEEERKNPNVTRGEGKNAVGSSSFFSVSTLRSVKRHSPDGGERTEYIYKAFSPEHLPDDKIDAFVGLAGGKPTWLYRHVWKAYPYEYPRVTFEEIKLADGLWYTGGMESFISTMETNSLMGMNVARLIADEWEAERKVKDALKLEAAAMEAVTEVASEKDMKETDVISAIVEHETLLKEEI